MLKDTLQSGAALALIHSEALKFTQEIKDEQRKVFEDVLDSFNKITKGIIGDQEIDNFRKLLQDQIDRLK